MSEEKKNQKKGHRKALKVIKWGLILSAGVVLLIFFGIPLYLSSTGGTNFLLGKINQSVDGQVQMDDFSMGWFKGVKLKKVSYADSAGNTSIAIERVETRPRYMSLLAGKVKLGKTVVKQPRVYVKVPAEQKVHPDTEKAETPSVKASLVKSDAPPPVFPVNQIDLELIDGAATVELTGDVPQKVSFTNIASKVQIAEPGKPSMLDVSMDVDGASKISAKGTATPSKKGWTLEDGDFNVQISKLQLGSLKPLFALAGQEMDMAGELNADAVIQVKNSQIQQLKTDAVISDFTQGSGDQRMVFQNPITVSAQAELEGESVKVDKLKIDSEFCKVGCSGTLESMTYTIDADLAKTQYFVGQFTDMGGLAMQGKLVADGQFSMTDQAVKAVGKGAIARLIVKKDGISTPMTDAKIDFNCTVDQEKKQLRLASANLAATPGTVKVANLVLPMGDEGDNTISLDAQAKLDLAQTWPFVQVFADIPKDVQLAGMLDSAVKVSTEGSRVQLLTDKTQITQLKITQPDTEPFQQDKISLTGDVVLDMEREKYDIRALDVKDSTGQSLIKVTKGTVEKKISQDTTKFSGDFEAEYDWRTVSALAAAYLPEGLRLQGKRKDGFNFDSVYPTAHPEKMTANLNAKGSLGFESAEYLGLNFGPTQLGLDIQKGVAQFNIPQTTVNDGKLNFSGIINLNEKPKCLRLQKPMTILDKVHINDTMARLLLMYTNPMFVDASQASGVASFDCRQMSIPLTGDDNNLLAMDGTFQIDSLRMRAGSFTKQILALFKQSDTVMMKLHPTDFLLNKGFLSYQDMQIDVEDNPLNFRGKIGLDKSLFMDVTLPWTLEFENVKVGDQSTGRITLPIEGTLDRPRIDTGKLLEQQGRQLLERELKKQLERLIK